MDIKRFNIEDWKYIEKDTQITPSDKATFFGSSKMLSDIDELIKLIEVDADKARKLATLDYNTEYLKANLEKEHNWATWGGIAQGLAGPAFGVLTALQTERENQAKRERNTDRIIYLASQQENIKKIQDEYWKLYFSYDRLKSKMQNYLDTGVIDKFKFESGEQNELFSKLNLKITNEYFSGGKIHIDLHMDYINNINGKIRWKVFNAANKCVVDEIKDLPKDNNVYPEYVSVYGCTERTMTLTRPCDKIYNYTVAFEPVELYTIKYLSEISTDRNTTIRNNEKIINCIYNNKIKTALELINTKDRWRIKDAIKILEEIKEHKTSESLLKRAIEELDDAEKKEKYEQAEEALKKHKYKKAKELYTEIPGWKDADIKLEKCNKKLSIKRRIRVILMYILTPVIMFGVIMGYYTNRGNTDIEVKHIINERLLNISAGDIIEFGTYSGYNDKDDFISGRVPIEWIVLETTNNSALVISKDILWSCDYRDIADVADDDVVNWKDSELRDYLNGKFYNSAFSKVEKKLINWSYIENKYIEDKLFILNDDEYKKYQDTSMKDYLITTDGWWLRGVHMYGLERLYIGHVEKDGDIVTKYAYKNGVRPAMWITIREE